MLVEQGPTGELLQKVQRDINCLLDPVESKNIRKNALLAIKTKLLASDVFPDHGRPIFEEHLLKNLVFVIADEIDFVRENALKVTELCLEKFQPLSTDTNTKVVETLLHRINVLPYPEKTEEVRLIIVTLIGKILVISKDAFRPHMSTASDALAKVLLDKFPDVKRQAAETVRLFCSKMPEQIGLNARQIIKSLAKNTEHNHSKIRKVSVEALTDILTVQHGGECFKDCETEIKKLLTDKSSDVRKEVYNLLGTCLKRFSYPDLKNFEVKLVKHLLSGLSEESTDTRQLVSKLLEQCGESRKQLEEELKTYSA